jgi:hypothetical protein
MGGRLLSFPMTAQIIQGAPSLLGTAKTPLYPLTTGVRETELQELLTWLPGDLSLHPPAAQPLTAECAQVALRHSFTHREG